MVLKAIGNRFILITGNCDHFTTKLQKGEMASIFVFATASGTSGDKAEFI
jgi:hypothetical protein